MQTHTSFKPRTTGLAGNVPQLTQALTLVKPTAAPAGLGGGGRGRGSTTVEKGKDVVAGS